MTPPSASPLSSTPVLVFLAVAIGLPLIALAAALMPAWALPAFVVSVLDRRRGDIVLAGIVFPLSAGVGLLLAVR